MTSTVIIRTATLAEQTKAGYRAVLIPFSANGRDLGPRVAARLDAPIASDVIALTAAGDSIIVRHPGYANKVIITLEVKGGGSPVCCSKNSTNKSSAPFLFDLAVVLAFTLTPLHLRQR